MKRENRMLFSIAWVVIGVVLIGLAFAGKVDAFWNGMGFALAIVGGLQLLRYNRFNKNPKYREAVEIAETDERNHFIRCKAWAWAGYLFILITALSVIGFRIVGQELLSFAASGAVCLMLVLYWGAYYFLKRKY
ncbi:MAG: hypothetical protein IKU44_04720 [Firmicutes bacterium]|nr:hypothetical protein [Bacillota bacterium]